MSYFHEYLDKMQKENLSILDLQQELSKQLGIINNAWECYSFILALDHQVFVLCHQKFETGEKLR